MIDREIEKYIGQQKVKVELDEQSVKQVRSKIDNLMKTLFK